MKYKLLTIISISLTLFCGKIKGGDTTIVIRPYDTNGTEISTQNPNGAGSACSYFYSATWTCGSNCIDRGVIKFDMSSVPANATIISASLSLYAFDTATIGITGSPTYGTDNAGWLERITSSWAYNTISWNTQPTTTATDEVTLAQSTGTSENYVLNVIQLVKDIISSGNNYGFELKQQDETNPYQSLVFASSDSRDSSLRPKLEITYVINTPGDTCVSIRPYDTNGTEISTQNPNGAGSACSYFYSAMWTCGSNCIDRGVIKFDMSSVPANATVTSAALSLYAFDTATIGITGSPTYGTDNAGWLERITSSWAYNTISWNTQPTTTATNEVALTQSTGVSENYVLDVTQLTKDIISSGNNYGFELKQQDETNPYQSLVFASSASRDSSLRPMLDICYHVPTSIAVISNPNINIDVYPNPANDEVVFKTSSSESVKNYYVQIYNISGQEVRNFQLYPYQVTINTSDLARGTYLYKVVGNNMVLKTGKLELQ